MKNLPNLEAVYGESDIDTKHRLMDFTNDLLGELHLLKIIGFDMNGRFVAIHSPINLHVPHLNDLYGQLPDEDIDELLDFANAVFQEVQYLKRIEYVDGRFIVTRVPNAPVVEIAPVAEAIDEAPPAVPDAPAAPAVPDAPAAPAVPDAPAAPAVPEAPAAPAAQIQGSLDAIALSVAEIMASLRPVKHSVGAGSRIPGALFSCVLEVITSLNLEVGRSVPLLDLKNRSLALFKARYEAAAVDDAIMTFYDEIMPQALSFLNSKSVAEGVEYKTNPDTLELNLI